MAILTNGPLRGYLGTLLALKGMCMYKWASYAPLVLLLFLSLACHTSDVPTDATPTSAGPETTPDDSGSPLKTHTAGAKIGDANCAIVLLHGYGAPGTDLLTLADAFALRGKPVYIFPEAPIQLAQGGRAWYELDGTGFDDSLAQIKQLLSGLATAHPKCPVVVGGFSQGATIASNVLDTSNCPTLRAAVLFSPDNFLQHPPRQREPLPKVLIAHGRNDTVLPFSGAEALRGTLSNLGCETTWVPFDGAHTISPEGLRSVNVLLQSVLQTATGDGAN